MEIASADKVFVRVTDFGRLHIRTRCQETGLTSDVFLTHDQASVLAKFIDVHNREMFGRSVDVPQLDIDFPDEELSDLQLMMKYPKGL